MKKENNDARKRITQDRRRIEEALKNLGAKKLSANTVTPTDGTPALLYSTLWHAEYGPDKLIFDYMLSLGGTECMIIYDGKMHFTRTGRETRLFDAANLDCEKDAYCLEKGIPVLRIRYDRLNNAEELIRELITYPERFLYPESFNPFGEYWQERTTALFVNR